MQVGNAADVPSIGRLVRPRSNGRYSRAISVQLLLPATVLALLFVGSVTDLSVYTYSLSAVARASGAIVVVAPFVALSAAFEMRVLRALWGRFDVRLPWYRVAIGRLWIVAGAGILAMAASYVLVVGPSFLTSVPSWDYAFVSVAGVLVWTSIGAALGLMFRPLIAMPIAVMAPYLALTLPGAWQPLWIRHLNGYLFDCCSTSQVLDLRAVAASVGMLIACGLAAWMLVFLRLGPAKPALRPLGTMLALAVGVALLAVGQAHHLGATPTAARAFTDLRCAGEVCLWPEDGKARHANEVAWTETQAAWTALGLPLSRTTIGPVSDERRLGVVALTTDPRVAAASMAAALPRAAAGCEGRYGDERASLAADQLAYLLLERAGAVDLLDLGIPADSVPAPSAAPELWRTLRTC